MEILSYDVLEALSNEERRELIQMRNELAARLDSVTPSCFSYSRSLVPATLDRIRQLFDEHHHDEFSDLRRLQSIFKEVPDQRRQ